MQLGANSKYFLHELLIEFIFTIQYEKIPNRKMESGVTKYVFGFVTLSFLEQIRSLEGRMEEIQNRDQERETRKSRICKDTGVQRKPGLQRKKTGLCI